MANFVILTLIIKFLPKNVYKKALVHAKLENIESELAYSHKYRKRKRVEALSVYFYPFILIVFWVIS